VLAVDLQGLVEQARQAGGFIEFVPQVGDFVAEDEPLFMLYSGAGAIDDRQVRAAVALGTERTLDQDPTFAFRILVDIAIKALSPAINDPTTAVLAIDQLHRLLCQVGLRHASREEFRDAAGDLRLVFRTPNWEDFVHLTCTEIRHCGAGSIQIIRRMRSLLENLEQTLPAHRHAELRQQLELLDREIDGHYPFPEDRALARIGLLHSRMAAHSAAAVAGIAANQPDLVLMDINLGAGPNGIETACLIRERLSIPLIFMTGHSDREIRKQVEALAPLACLDKPLDIPLLLELLERAG
jgi:CheY-like chemotaxis protein